MKDIGITQSMIKSIADIENKKECGLVFKSLFIDNEFDKYPTPEAANIGCWFEYKCTGALPKNNKIPEPKVTQKGELTAAYKRIENQISYFHRIMKEYDIEIVESGKTINQKITIENEEYTISGTLDLVCKARKDIIVENNVFVKKNELFIVDIKTTALLDDKWSEFGWDIDNLYHKPKLMTQPVHYKFLCKLEYGKDLPFMFFLFSSSNENDCRIFAMNLDECVYDQHVEDIRKTIGWMKYYLKNSFPALPTTARCHSCPLKDSCKFKREIPEITNVYYSNQMNV